MAKYRHRTFEMFEFPDEAAEALAPQSARPVTEADDPESLTLQVLTVSHSGNVIHVKLKNATSCDSESLRELRRDFTILADFLKNDSRVLFDFEGVQGFSPASIAALEVLGKKLKSKGSRLVLCNLADEVRSAFFPNQISC